MKIQRIVKMNNMNNATPLLYVLLLLMLPFFMAAQEADTTMTLSVSRAQEYAVQHNLNVKNAELEVIKADKEVWETTASGLPQANLEGSFRNNLSLSTQLFPNFIEPTIMKILMDEGVIDPQPIGEPDKIPVQFGSQFNASATLQVNQLVFSGPYIVGLQASQVYRRLSKEQLTKSKLDTKASVAQTYFLILLSGENISILEENLQNLRKIVSDSRAMQEQGFMESTAVDQVEIQANTLENQLKSTQRQHKSYYDLLKIQLGVPLTQKVALTDSLTGIINRLELGNQIGLDFKPEENVQYKMAETQERLSELDLKRQKFNNLPQLNAFFSYTQNAMRDNFNFFDTDKEWFESSMLGLQLNIPLFASGQRYSRIQQAELSLEKARNSKELARRNLMLSMKQARDKYLTALDKYETQQKNKKLAQRVFQHTSEKFQEGMASSTELTQANNQYLQTVSGYVGAVVELLNAKIQLDKLMNDL